MRRWLTLLLLIIVPLQLTQAVAAAYCGHENGRAAQHLGHHVHQHHDDPAQAGGHGDSKVAGTVKAAHDDCGSCHASMPQVLMQRFGMAPPPPGGTRALPAGRHFSSADPGRIDRPNWTRSP